MFRAQAISAQIGTKEIWISVALRGMIGLEYQLVFWCSSCEQKAEMDDAEDDVVESARDGTEVEERDSVKGRQRVNKDLGVLAVIIGDIYHGGWTSFGSCSRLNAGLSFMVILVFDGRAEGRKQEDKNEMHQAVWTFEGMSGGVRR